MMCSTIEHANSVLIQKFRAFYAVDLLNYVKSLNHVASSKDLPNHAVDIEYGKYRYANEQRLDLLIFLYR